VEVEVEYPMLAWVYQEHTDRAGVRVSRVALGEQGQQDKVIAVVVEAEHLLDMVQVVAVVQVVPGDQAPVEGGQVLVV
jgi:hypothetical protein